MKNEPKKTMPAINQVFRDAALQHLTESGLPESLIDGVDCSTLEAMEESLFKVKDCFYSSVRKHIEETYGVKEERPETLLRRMEYQDRNWWDMFKGMNCDPENNKYIANLHCNQIRVNCCMGKKYSRWKNLIIWIWYNS